MRRNAMLRLKAMVVILFLGFAAADTFCQPQENLQVGVPALLQKLQSGRSSERIGAFYQLLALLPKSDVASNSMANIRERLPALSVAGSHDDASVILALAELLVKENRFVQTHQFVSQGFAEYYGDLIWSVSSLNDIRTSDALLGAVSTGDMATRALASFGPNVLDRVIVKLTSADVLTRIGATRVLSEMLDETNIAKVRRQDYLTRIEAALLTVSADTDPYVRISAIEGLSKVGDPNVIPMVASAAQNDEYEASTHGGTSGVFPVRDAARRVLLQLSEHSK
jgi:HEAT repeat protein